MLQASSIPKPQNANSAHISWVCKAHADEPLDILETEKLRAVEPYDDLRDATDAASAGQRIPQPGERDHSLA
jgi:hypothetical protein